MQSRKDKSIMVLVGNKCDLEAERKVTIEEATNLAANEGIKYFEVSAKNNSNIKKIFTFAASEYAQENFGNEVTIDNIDNLRTSDASHAEKK